MRFLRQVSDQAQRSVFVDESEVIRAFDLVVVRRLEDAPHMPGVPPASRTDFRPTTTSAMIQYALITRSYRNGPDEMLQFHLSQNPSDCVRRSDVHAVFGTDFRRIFPLVGIGVRTNPSPPTSPPSQEAILARPPDIEYPRWRQSNRNILVSFLTNDCAFSLAVEQRG